VSLEKTAVVDIGNWDVNSWQHVAPSVSNVLTQLESYYVASIPKQSQKLLVWRILARCPVLSPSRDAAGDKQVYGGHGTCRPYSSSASGSVSLPLGTWSSR